MSFKVPNQYRIKSGFFGSDDSAGNCGAFAIPFESILLKVIATDGIGVMDNSGIEWEHVSA
jgi:hypothetical protein